MISSNLYKEVEFDEFEKPLFFSFSTYFSFRSCLGRIQPYGCPEGLQVSESIPDREVHLHVQQYLRLGKGTFYVVDVVIIVDIIDIHYFILHYILLFVFLMLSTLSLLLKFLMFLKVTALKDF